MVVSMCAGRRGEKDGIADYSGYLAEGIRQGGVDVQIVPLGHYVGEDRYYADAARKACEADICHVQFNYLYFNGEMPYRNKFLYFADGVGIPLVMTAHEVRIGFQPLAVRVNSIIKDAAFNLSLPILNRWSVSLHARMYARARKVIVHTDAHAKAVRALTKGKDKVVFIPHGIPEVSDSDRGVSRPEAKRRLGLEGRRVLAIPGFINKKKGYEMMLEALSGLPEDVVLLVAGGRMTENATDVEYYKTLEKMISAKGLEGRVRITGYLEKGDIPAIFAAADLIVAPFSSTTASGALSLCLGYHKPVIASDIPVHAEINERVPCLELFRNGDASDLLRKVKMLLADAGRLAALQTCPEDTAMNTVIPRWLRGRLNCTKRP
jgi:glycosyltransferase involved in cell wall biosynthesis